MVSSVIGSHRRPSTLWLSLLSSLLRKKLSNELHSFWPSNSHKVHRSPPACRYRTAKLSRNRERLTPCLVIPARCLSRPNKSAIPLLVRGRPASERKR